MTFDSPVLIIRSY